MSKHQPVLLIVDDDPFAQEVISEFLDGQGYQLVVASCGEEAWDKLQAEPDKFDAVLLDRVMPGIDGLEVLQRIKQSEELKLLPVIMQTAASAPAQVAEVLRAGAYYCLAKPFVPGEIRAVVATALRDRVERITETRDAEYRLLALNHLDEAHFTFRTTEEARALAVLLACLCPSRATAQMGLLELMLNAIEHGNLGITYDEKTRLIAEDRLQAEIKRRLSLPEYAEKIATVQFRRAGKTLSFTIKDEGQGFDWKPFLEMSMDRLMENHGRGIAISRRVSFSRLEYRDSGNCAEATIIPATLLVD